MHSVGSLFFAVLLSFGSHHPVQEMPKPTVPSWIDSAVPSHDEIVSGRYAEEACKACSQHKVKPASHKR